MSDSISMNPKIFGNHIFGMKNLDFAIVLHQYNQPYLTQFHKPHCRGIVYALVGFVALRPKSTAMVIAGRSVHLTTLFPGQA